MNADDEENPFRSYITFCVAVCLDELLLRGQQACIFAASLLRSAMGLSFRGLSLFVVKKCTEKQTLARGGNAGYTNRRYRT